MKDKFIRTAVHEVLNASLVSKFRKINTTIHRNKEKHFAEITNLLLAGQKDCTSPVWAYKLL